MGNGKPNGTMCEENMTNTSEPKFEVKHDRMESGDESYESEWLGRTGNGGIHMNLWGKVGDRIMRNGSVIWDTSSTHISTRVQKFDDLIKTIRKSFLD